MKTITYHGLDGKDFTEEYDETAPCIICGEPIIAASMGGTAVCPWCDTGKCRYCRMPIFVLKEQYDEGRSKQELLKHMKWHREHPTPPELTQWQKDALQRMMEIHEKNQKPGENMCSGLGQQDGRDI